MRGEDGFEGEATQGAVTQLPGASVVYATQLDGLGHYAQFGIYALSNVTGRVNNAGNIFFGVTSSGAVAANGIGKSNGLGDIELLCDPAPIEIGNRVWNDLDGDGVQDPGEPGLSGITVSRQGPTNTVTTNTDANGLYYFNNLRSNTAYTLTLNVPAGYNLTQVNSQALSGAGVSSNHAISDTIDSDATLVGSVARIVYTTGTAGQNNHGLDFGFTQPVYGRVGIVNSYTAPALPSYTLRKTLRTPSPVPVGGSVTFGIQISNTGSVTITTLPLSDRYNPSDLLFRTASVAPNDSINDGQLDWNDLTTALGDLGPGRIITLTTTFVARRSAPNTLNLAQSGALTSTAIVSTYEVPTAVELSSRSAVYDLSSGVTLQWSTASEAELVGFHLLRRTVDSAEWVQLTSELILAQQPGQARSGSYTFSDPTAQFGQSYLYLLEIVDSSGNASRRELGLVQAGSRALLPLVAR